MALRFMDSFDHYVTADLLEKWPANTGTISAGNGRRSTAALSLQYGGLATQSTLGNQPTYIAGWALRVTALAEGRQLRFLDVTSEQISLYMLTDGRWQVRRGGTTLGTSTAMITAGTSHYVEMAATIHSTTGAVTVRLNGIEILALTNVNTQQTANAYANSLQWMHFDGNHTNMYIDDVYICDGTGAAPHNGLLGDCRVDALLPNGEGSNSAWTPNSGTVHYDRVDETAPNDDTDYLSTSTASARDTHAMTNLPSMPTPTIYGVQHCMALKKEDAGTCSVKSALKSGSTTTTGASQALATSYTYYRELYTTDPNTGVAWTTAGVDAVEAGVEKV